MQTIGNAYLDRTTNERKTHGRILKRKPCLEAVILSAGHSRSDFSGIISRHTIYSIFSENTTRDQWTTKTNPRNLEAKEKETRLSTLAPHHSRVLFLEPFVQPSRTLERLVHTAHHATLLARGERFGSKVGDAVVEAALDEFRVHLVQSSESAFPESDGRETRGRHTPMNSLSCFFSMRLASSRCSEALRLVESAGSRDQKEKDRQKHTHPC